MRVLDLFSGLRGWSAAFADRGHETFTIDFDPRFDADAYLDIGDTAAVLDALPWRPDLILASPPCTAFTTMTMGRNWTHEGEPKTDRAREGQRLVLATLRLVAILRPGSWILENPRARLRSLGLLDGIERRTVWYCRLGETRAKPTDLWGVFPPGLVLPPGCHNGNPDHVAAPRGSYTGTQGMDSADAAKVPYALSALVADAYEPVTLNELGALAPDERGFLESAWVPVSLDRWRTLQEAYERGSWIHTPGGELQIIRAEYRVPLPGHQEVRLAFRDRPTPWRI